MTYCSLCCTLIVSLSIQITVLQFKISYKVDMYMVKEALFIHLTRLIVSLFRLHINLFFYDFCYPFSIYRLYLKHSYINSISIGCFRLLSFWILLWDRSLCYTFICMTNTTHKMGTFFILGVKHKFYHYRTR